MKSKLYKMFIDINDIRFFRVILCACLMRARYNSLTIVVDDIIVMIWFL